MDPALPLQGLLQSLGWAILHSFWQMALLWLAYQLLFGWRTRLSPTLRHNAAFLLLTAGSAWFLQTFVHEYTKFWQVDRYLSQLPDAGQLSTTLATGDMGVSVLQQAWTNISAQYITYISAIYLLALAFMTWKLLKGFLQARILRHQGVIPVSPEMETQVALLARQLAIPQEIKVYLSRLVDVPATLGFLKPVILLPVSSLTQLSPAQLESILLHELAHIRRLDYLVNIGVLLMETMQFHNPFAWLLVRAIRQERELCCDDMVLSCRQDALEYASALLCLEKTRTLPALSMALASNGRKGQLLHRIRRMTRMPATQKTYADRLLAVCLVFLLMASMAWIGPSTSRAHTRSKIAPASIAETQPIWILHEPHVNLVEKPRPKKTIVTQKILKTGNMVTESIEQDIRIQSVPNESTVAGGNRMVFVNEAPPEGFSFLFERPEWEEMERDVVVSMPKDLILEKRMLMDLTTQERAMALQQEQLQALEWENLARKHRTDVRGQNRETPDQQIIFREFRKIADTKKEDTRQPVVKSRTTTPPHRSPSRVIAPAPPPFVRQEADLKALAESLREQQFWMNLIPEPGAPNPRKGPVKVNRVKTKDGYSLRIETGTESIDIRIGEDDIIVEKH